MFEGHPAFYFLTARKFFHAGCRLEEVADFGDTIWTQEMDKLGFKNRSHLNYLKYI